MNAMRCDRCKKFYVVTDKANERPAVDGRHIFGAQVIDMHDNHLRKFDLCTDCAIKVYNYLYNILIETYEELGNKDILLVSREDVLNKIRAESEEEGDSDEHGNENGK